jgi:hypothetical protein
MRHDTPQPLKILAVVWICALIAVLIVVYYQAGDLEWLIP